MKAAFTLIPEESKRLIAKAVVQTEEVKAARKKAYILIMPGTSNAYVAQELLGAAGPDPRKYTAGINSHRLLCVTDPDKREPMPIILHKGELSSKDVAGALTDFHLETVIIKGANAIDREGNVGLIVGGFDGGGIAKTVGTVVSQGLRYIVPVGLEKMVPSVKEATASSGAKRLDYSIGADFGMIPIPNAVVITEIEALKILAGVEATHVASGGIGESAGSVILVIEGDEKDVKKAVSIVEAVKGEPRLAGFKGTCECCRYACKFAGTKSADLPPWLSD